MKKRLIYLSLLSVAITLIILFPNYSKWHLKNFNGGTIYTLLNLIAPPDDYFKAIYDSKLAKNNTDFSLTHLYKGKYVIKIKTKANLKFSGNLICGNKEITFNLKEEVNKNEYWLAIYSVEQDLLMYESNCKFNYPSPFSNSRIIIEKLIHH